MKYGLLVVALIGLMACKPKENPFDVQAEKAAISEVMHLQEEAWNRADPEGFMAGYWRSDSLCFVGKKGLTYGWQATLDNYKKSYPGAESMGHLVFTNKIMEVPDSNHAFVVGKWELFRTADTLSGHYSLFWRKMNGKWFIVADHSS